MENVWEHRTVTEEQSDLLDGQRETQTNTLDEGELIVMVNVRTL